MHKKYNQCPRNTISNKAGFQILMFLLDCYGYHDSLAVTFSLTQSESNIVALILFFEVRTSMLLLLGSTQCNGQI